MSAKKSASWVAQAGSQVLFLSSPIFETLYEGTRGPGKTDALLMDFAQHTGQGFEDQWRGILFRQTYKQLADVVAKSKRWFRQIFPKAKFNAGSFTWEFPGGEQLLLRHMRKPDDYWNYHGHEYPWIGWEELTNWPTLECYESMKSCSRSSMPGMPRKYRATCNPFGIGHNAVKNYFIDPMPRGSVLRLPNQPPRVAIHGNIHENKILLASDPEYIQKLQSITSEAKRKAWLYGDWDITAGGMFDDVWDPDTHILRPFPIPDDWRIERSFDWGSSKPFSVGWHARCSGSPAVLPHGQLRNFSKNTLIRVGEWYGWNGEANTGVKMQSADIGKGILRREKDLFGARRVEAGPADASIYDIVDGKSIAAQMEKVGVYFIPSNKGPGSRKNGWQVFRDRLHAANDWTIDTDTGIQIPRLGVAEEQAYFVFDTCRQFIRTVPGLPRDPLDMDDVDTEAEDHIADEVRYEMTHTPKIVSQRDM